MTESSQHQNVEVHYWHLKHEILLAVVESVICFDWVQENIYILNSNNNVHNKILSAAISDFISLNTVCKIEKKLCKVDNFK